VVAAVRSDLESDGLRLLGQVSDPPAPPQVEFGP
jgi:hypothetical protein